MSQHYELQLVFTAGLLYNRCEDNEQSRIHTQQHSMLHVI